MLPDFRIQFPPTTIDFTKVGKVGTVIDSYPNPGDPARFDWLRSVILGLLTNQASFAAPVHATDGTIWFDLNNLVFRVKKQGNWVPLSDAIILSTNPDGTIQNLSQWYQATQATVGGMTPIATFSGYAVTEGVVTIQIPPALVGNIGPNSRPFMFINGLMADPRNVGWSGPAAGKATTIQLTGGLMLHVKDRFTVVFQNVANFYTPDVVV